MTQSGIMRRMFHMSLAWLVLGAFVGISMGVNGGTIYLISQMIAGMIVLSMLGAMLGLFVNSYRGSLIGGCIGAIIALIIQVEPVSMYIIMGGLVGATFLPWIQACTKTILFVYKKSIGVR